MSPGLATASIPPGEDLTTFWVPLQLRKYSSLCHPNGHPKRLLITLQRIQLRSMLLLIPSVIFVAGMMVIHTEHLHIWSSIDAKTCPITLQCADPCVVEADPDISGIGVRIAIYTQTICNILLIGFSSSASRINSTTYSALVLTSLSTVVTIAVVLWTGNMSLHHFTVATSLLTVSIFPLFLLESWRVPSPRLFLATQARLIIYWAVMLNLVFYMPCLGDDSSCNLCTRYTWFGVERHVISTVNRSFKLGAVGISFIFVINGHVWTYGPGNALKVFPALISRREKQAWIGFLDESRTSLTTWRRKNKQLFRENHPKGWYWGHIWIWLDDGTTARDGIAKLHRGRLESEFWLDRVLTDIWLMIRVPRCQRAMVGLAIAIVLIYDTERAVNINLTAGQNNWGYGQIFALVATVPSVGDLIKLILQVGRKRE